MKFRPPTPERELSIEFSFDDRVGVLDLQWAFRSVEGTQNGAILKLDGSGQGFYRIAVIIDIHAVTSENNLCFHADSSHVIADRVFRNGGVRHDASARPKD